jgi:hypothetical protein
MRGSGFPAFSVGNAIARVYQRSFPLRNRAAGVNPRSAGPKPGAPMTRSDHETGSSVARARDPATLDADGKQDRGFTPAARLRSRKGLWFSHGPYGKRRSKTAIERLDASKPELVAYLRGLGGKELVERIAAEFMDSIGATTLLRGWGAPAADSRRRTEASLPRLGWRSSDGVCEGQAPGKRQMRRAFLPNRSSRSASV